MELSQSKPIAEIDPSQVNALSEVQSFVEELASEHPGLDAHLAAGHCVEITQGKGTAEASRVELYAAAPDEYLVNFQREFPRGGGNDEKVWDTDELYHVAAGQINRINLDKDYPLSTRGNELSLGKIIQARLEGLKSSDATVRIFDKPAVELTRKNAEGGVHALSFNHARQELALNPLISRSLARRVGSVIKPLFTGRSR